VSTAGDVVRIYISTTYDDMHSERDVLAREVFPRLRERFGPRGIHVVGVDLRWGVEGERDEDLGIILDEIERSRPFFVGILGERYGRAASVPDGISPYGIPDASGLDRPIEAGNGLSLTAMEILHGVLEHPETKETSFFYLRDPGFSVHVPEYKRREFVHESEEAVRKLAEIKDRIRGLYADIPANLFEAYPCSFAGLEIDWHKHRQHLANRLAPKDFAIIAGDAETGNPVSEKNLLRLCDEALSVFAKHSVVRLSNLDEFSERIYRDLQNAIEDKFLPYRKHYLRPQVELYRKAEHILRPQKITNCMERLEEENGKETVKATLSLIACSEEGLYEDELSVLTASIAMPLPPMKWARMYRRMADYLRDGGREGIIEFINPDFKDEVFKRYIPDKKTERKIYSAIAKYAFVQYLTISSTDEIPRDGGKKTNTLRTVEKPLIGPVRHAGIYCLRAANKDRTFDLIASLLSLTKDQFEKYKVIFDLMTEMMSSSVPEKDLLFFPILEAVLDVFIETRKDRAELVRLSEFLYGSANDSVKKGRNVWGKAFATIALKTIDAASLVKAKKSYRINSIMLRSLRDRILEISGK